MAAPPHLGAHAVLFDRPLAAGPRHLGEIVRGVRELDDVQPARRLMGRHRGQVRDEVVQREQVAERVQHRDSEIKATGDAEVPHVRLDDVEVKPGGRRLRRRVRAHRRGAVERGRPQSAAGELQRVFGRARGEFDDRLDGRARIPLPVTGAPAQQGADFDGDVPVGTGELVQLGFVVDAAHLSNDAGSTPRAGREAARETGLSAGT